MKTTDFKIPDNLKEQYERVMRWQPPDRGLTFQEARPLKISDLPGEKGSDPLRTERSDLIKIHHKLPNWLVLPAAMVILPFLFFSFGRATANKPDNANAYYHQAKEQILGLAASPKPKSSAKDYLLESKEAFQRAQEISQEAELSEESKNKVTNLINLALQTLSDGIVKHPNEPALYFERATIYKAISQATPEAKQGALKDLETALKLAPNDPNILAFYGRFLAEEGEIEKAKNIFNQLLTLLPQDSQDYQTVLGWLNQLTPLDTGDQTGSETIRDREQSFDPGSKNEPASAVGPEEKLDKPIDLESDSTSKAGEMTSDKTPGVDQETPTPTLEITPTPEGEEAV